MKTDKPANNLRIKDSAHLLISHQSLQGGWTSLKTFSWQPNNRPGFFWGGAGESKPQAPLKSNQDTEKRITLRSIQWE